jgi:hypothetical protein
MTRSHLQHTSLFPDEVKIDKLRMFPTGAETEITFCNPLYDSAVGYRVAILLLWCCKTIAEISVPSGESRIKKGDRLFREKSVAFTRYIAELR